MLVLPLQRVESSASLINLFEAAEYNYRYILQISLLSLMLIKKRALHTSIISCAYLRFHYIHLHIDTCFGLPRRAGVSAGQRGQRASSAGLLLKAVHKAQAGRARRCQQCVVCVTISMGTSITKILCSMIIVLCRKKNMKRLAQYKRCLGNYNMARNKILGNI